MGHQQMDCDSAPKQNIMFCLTVDDTKIFKIVDDVQSLGLHKELCIERVDTTAPATWPPGVAKSSNLLASFVTQHWWLTKHKELEGSDPQRPGSRRWSVHSLCIRHFDLHFKLQNLPGKDYTDSRIKRSLKYVSRCCHLGLVALADVCTSVRYFLIIFGKNVSHCTGVDLIIVCE